MQIFIAGIGTETNTFSPLPTGLNSFYSRAYFPSGKYPDQPTRYGILFNLIREKAKKQPSWKIYEGLYAEAQPSGLVTRMAYESLRDELLDELRHSLPIDIVFLGLHGAMVADGYDDCEGDLIDRVREIVGENTVIGCEIDPHAHLSNLMIEKSNILVAYKEYPHVDIKERAEELIDYCFKIYSKTFNPTVSVVDTNIVVPIHTTRDPGRTFINKIKQLEKNNKVISISAIQGFATGDVYDMGSKILVYTNQDQNLANTLASELSKELTDLKGELVINYQSIDEAISSTFSNDKYPVIFADRSDNPGSGAAGDSTFILKELLDMKITNVAIGPIWDPIAVEIAFSAGIGAKLALRVGGKISPMSGQPIDGIFEILNLKKDHVMTGQSGEQLNVGNAALISINEIEILLISIRSQAINQDLFYNIGCNLAEKKLIVLKSAQHFYTSFSEITDNIIYVAALGSATPNYCKLPYKKAKLPKWPITLNHNI